jgi:hypothetical protein
MVFEAAMVQAEAATVQAEAVKVQAEVVAVMNQVEAAAAMEATLGLYVSAKRSVLKGHLLHADHGQMLHHPDPWEDESSSTQDGTGTVGPEVASTEKTASNLGVPGWVTCRYEAQTLSHR